MAYVESLDQFSKPSRGLGILSWGIAIIYGWSGFTSLAYEVLWSRLVSMQFGVSIYGVVLTVAAFMIGLGAGSLIGLFWFKQCKKPLLIFAFLEVAIALYALLLPSISQELSTWMSGVASQLTWSAWYVLQGVDVLCLLIFPAFAMGLGFVLVIKSLDGIPLSLGKVYGLNTLGGAIGALFPLLSLPAIGWNNSVRVVAVAGLFVGMAAFMLQRLYGERSFGLQLDTDVVKDSPPRRILLIYALIGAGSIMLEIGWVRLYGMIMLRTEYVLGVILAVYLMGIALGSWVVPRIQRKGLPELMPLIVGAAVLVCVWLLPITSAWIERLEFNSLLSATWLQVLILGVFTFPVTLALGAWLPILTTRHGHSDSSGIWFYGVNCLGGGLGAVLGCLILMPVFGSVAMVIFAGLLISASGLLLIKSSHAWLIYGGMVLLAGFLVSMPPTHKLLPKIETASQDLYVYEDAISLTHVVQQPDGQRVLLSDLQRMDASTDPNAIEIQMDQARLPLLLHAAPHSILFLGLGTGISMAGSLPYPELQRSAVELSQGAIYAAQHWFDLVNSHVMDKGQIYRDDARHFLGATPKQYDVIVGDLFHPDIAGMGSLLSIQQFQRARNRLNSNGIFVQWIALNQFDIQSLSVVLRTFKNVFPDAQLFMDGMHLALVGPKDKFFGAKAMLANLQRLSIQAQSGATGGEGVWTWLGRYWGGISVGSGPVQDELVPFIEFNLPRARYDGSVNLVALMRWLLTQHSSVESAMTTLSVSAEDKREFGRAYVSTELMARGWGASIQGDVDKANELTWLAYQANPQDRWIANALADNMMASLPQATQHGLSERDALLRVLKIAPDHVGALRAIWHLARQQNHQQEAEHYQIRLTAISPLDTEVLSFSKLHH